MHSFEHKITMATLNAAELVMRKIVYGLIWLTE